APYLTDGPSSGHPMSQAQLDERIRLQRWRAVLAEEYILRSEQERLIAAGCEDLAEGVFRISEDDVTAGFDILSFDVSGKRRKVEVKSSAGPREWFMLSANEYRIACEEGNDYWIAWVGWSARLPNGPCDIQWFQDPAGFLEKP